MIGLPFQSLALSLHSAITSLITEAENRRLLGVPKPLANVGGCSPYRLCRASPIENSRYCTLAWRSTGKTATEVRLLASTFRQPCDLYVVGSYYISALGEDLLSFSWYACITTRGSIVLRWDGWHALNLLRQGITKKLRSTLTHTVYAISS
jgi:hypothetical protein